MTSRNQQKRQTRQAFFQAVLDVCMAGQSFSAISLRQITREVGVVPTAFYRHFSDMNELGYSLVKEELGTALAELRKHLQFGKKRTFHRQIATSIELFFQAIDKHPSYWQFIVTERYGGNQTVQDALAEQIRIFTQILGHDLGLQPAFCHLNDEERILIADMGINLFFSWVYDWLKINGLIPHQSLNPHHNTVIISRNQYLARCTHQAKLLFYGVSNWQNKQNSTSVPMNMAKIAD